MAFGMKSPFYKKGKASAPSTTSANYPSRRPTLGKMKAQGPGTSYKRLSRNVALTKKPSVRGS